MELPEIIITEDGSHSLKMVSLNEYYHSSFGALAESRHVFIDAGLKKLIIRDIPVLNILEIGMGTGLNVLLSIIESVIAKKEVHYTSLEPFPLEENIWKKLNFSKLIDEQMAGEWFEKIHKCSWNEKNEITPGFSLTKVQCKLQEYNQEEKYNLIYFDAFGPDVQPDLWKEDIFHKIADMTDTEGILVTYSAKGSVRRALQDAGFVVERIPGPRGKREMIRGTRCRVQGTR